MQAKNIIMQAISKKTVAIIILLFTVMVAIVLKIMAVTTIKYIIDEILPTPRDQDSGLGVRVAMFVILVGLWFITELSSKIQSVSLGTSITTNLSSAVYSSAMRAEISELNKYKNVELTKKVTDDCIKIGNFVGKTWVDFWKEIIIILSLLIAMISIQSLMSTITLVTFPLFYMMVRGLEKYSAKLNQKAAKELSNRKEIVEDNFQKIRSIKLKNGVIQEEDKFHHLNEDYAKVNMQQGSFSNLSSEIIINLFIGFVVAINLGVGGLLIIQRQMSTTVGELVAMLILIPFVFTSLKKVMGMSIHSSNIEAEMKSLDAVLSMKSELKSEPVTSLEDIHSLKFENVSCSSYNGNDGVEDLSFELKRGEKFGIVAYDGTSNNTIFELLTKIIRPKEGVISINNCDINKLNTFYLREIITAVPQEENLFNDTISNNITYPLSFDEYKYNDALNRSFLKDILATFPDHDATVIDKEHHISQELIQRITIANAFYKDSKIFVLNEATSSLDVRSEEAIMKEIYKLKNKIAIIMSNKVYNLINCDKILIMDKDQVLEYGTVQELLTDKNSLFYSMIKKVKITKTTKVS